jgi:hypothetical protein
MPFVFFLKTGLLFETNCPLKKTSKRQVVAAQSGYIALSARHTKYTKYG